MERKECKLNTLIKAEKVCFSFKDEEENIKPVVTIKKSIKAPVKRGQVVGSVKYVVGNGMHKEYMIRISKNVEEKDYIWSFGVVFMRFILH